MYSTCHLGDHLKSPLYTSNTYCLQDKLSNMRASQTSVCLLISDKSFLHGNAKYMFEDHLLLLYRFSRLTSFFGGKHAYSLAGRELDEKIDIICHTLQYAVLQGSYVPDYFLAGSHCQAARGISRNVLQSAKK